MTDGQIGFSDRKENYFRDDNLETYVRSRGPAGAGTSGSHGSPVQEMIRKYGVIDLTVPA